MDIEIYENGELSPTYKRKQTMKRIKATLAAIQDISGVIAHKAGTYAAKQLDELTRPVRLEYFDYKYHTNLRAQYFSGKRTQQILAAKRSFNLI